MKKIAVDCGHGMGSKHFDPGASNGVFREADIVLHYGFALAVELYSMGWEYMLLRTDNTTPVLLDQRVARAQAARCDALISIHCNSFVSLATGTETLYRDAKPLALGIQAGLVQALGLRDRGVKYRPNLAILKFPNSAIIELGFINNPIDLARIMQPASPKLVAAAVGEALRAFFAETH